jgi:hypothetical protein
MWLATTFVLLAFISWVVTMSLAGASRKDVVAADTAYADKLYTTFIDQFFYRLGPVNSWVLFRRRPPIAVARRIRALRIAVAVQLCATIGFLACVATLMLAGQ